MERYEEKRGTTKEGYLLRGPSGYYTEPMERRRVQRPARRRTGGPSRRAAAGEIDKALPRCNLPMPRRRISSAFDDPNLIAYGGLEPVVRLAERCGLPKLAGEHVRLPASKDGRA
jgi:hypothetical protein